MSVITYENITPSLIPNTTMQIRLIDGVRKQYIIYPVDGYVLHDNTLDEIEYDPETGEPIRTVKLGYYPIGRSCGYNYDFTPVTVTDENGVTHTGYGSREFFARPQSEVPADQIFTLPDSEHEVM